MKNYLIVEVKRGAIVCTRFQWQRGTLVFIASDQRPLPESEAFAGALAELAPLCAGAEKIILSVDPTLLTFRELELPLKDRRKLREILPLELKGETALDVEALAFDSLPQAGGKVLAIWAKRAELARLIGIMTAAGLEPQIVTAELFAWQHLLAHEGNRGYYAIADSEALSVYHNHQPVYFRVLPEGELVGEISRTLLALELSKGIKVEQVYLLGSAAHDAADPLYPVKTGDYLFSRLPLAGELAGAFASDNTAAASHAGAFAVARAGRIGEPVNFRYGELAYTVGIEQNRKKLRLTAFLAAGFLFLLLAEAGVRYALVQRDVNSINRSIYAIYHELLPSRKKPIDEVAEVKAEIKRLGGSMATSEVLATLTKLADAKDDGIIGLYEAEIEGNQVRLKGEARSGQTVEQFKGRLSSVFDKAEINEVNSLPNGNYGFVFRGTLRGGDK